MQQSYSRSAVLYALHTLHRMGETQCDSDPLPFMITEKVGAVSFQYLLCEFFAHSRGESDIKL